MNRKRLGMIAGLGLLLIVSVCAPVILGYATLGLYDVKVDMEDPQGVSDSRTDAGDIEYWALVIGVSEYEDPAYSLPYCDDDAIDISSALVNYQGWDPGHIFLLLNSDATWGNVIEHLSILSDDYVDSNDVFLLTFSGHGTHGVDSSGDELDGMDEYVVLHDAYLSDDNLEIALGWFDTNKIMVFIDSCFSGGFIKGTFDYREEDLVSRCLPGTNPVELEDSFSRDLDKAGFVVLTACDDDETCVESSLLQNGVFTYYFVEGIESGFPADSNINDYISAEEAFYYASPLTNVYIPSQNPQLYDGVPGELEFTVRSCNYSISGTVFFSSTPLDNVLLELRDAEEIPISNTSTYQGFYSFSNVTSGIYWIKAHGPTPEYVPSRNYKVEVTDHNVTRNIYLPKLLNLLSPEDYSNVTNSRPTLSWEAFPNAYVYYISVHEMSNWTWSIWEDSQFTNHTLQTELSDGKEYAWSVYAYDADCHLIGHAWPVWYFRVNISAIFEIELYTGWNLIGLPTEPDDPNIETVLSDTLPFVESVWTYDGKTKEWYSYSPGVPSDLTEMDLGKGYWIKMTTDMIWEIDIS